MRLSAITDEFSQDLGHALDIMREFGCKDAELRNVYNKYIVDADEEMLQKVEKELKRTQMSVPCIDTPFYKCDLEGDTNIAAGPTHGAVTRTLEDQMHLLQHAIDLCKRFDAPYIRIFSFWKKGPLTPEIEDKIADALVRPCEIAQRAGVTLLLENEHACYLGTGAETARVIETVGSPALKMIWDPGNAFMAGEHPFPSGYNEAKAHVAHLHIKDARVGDDGKLTWTRVGEGEIDYVGQFQALKADGFTGVVALETHWKGPNGDKEEASRLCLESLKQMIENA
ncbi:MAG: sugar phosphate isomerase/epimerase [Armatimonadaceae bacterium]